MRVADSGTQRYPALRGLITAIRLVGYMVLAMVAFALAILAQLERLGVLPAATIVVAALVIAIHLFAYAESLVVSLDSEEHLRDIRQLLRAQGASSRQ